MESLIDRLRSGPEMSLGDKLLAGVEVSVFAMVVVFAVLILLMFIVKLMGSVIKGGAKKVQDKTEALPMSQQTAAAVQQVAVDDGEAVAAIVAAISAMSKGNDCKIVVRNITRLNDAWAEAGLLEQINSRL